MRHYLTWDGKLDIYTESWATITCWADRTWEALRRLGRPGRSTGGPRAWAWISRRAFTGVSAAQRLHVTFVNEAWRFTSLQHHDRSCCITSLYFRLAHCNLGPTVPLYISHDPFSRKTLLLHASEHSPSHVLCKRNGGPKPVGEACLTSSRPNDNIVGGGISGSFASARYACGSICASKCAGRAHSRLARCLWDVRTMQKQPSTCSAKRPQSPEMMSGLRSRRCQSSLTTRP